MQNKRQIFINYLFIMQKLIQRSLKTTILQQISHLNIANAQFYALLRKLNVNDHRLNEAFNQKLQSMKNDIRNKLKQLASNVDLMYQMIDRKISILIHRMQQNTGDSLVVQQQLQIYKQKIQGLEKQVIENKNKYNLLLSQNQYLKTKNIALIEELNSITRKKTTATNDSSQNINLKTDITGQHQISVENYGSPLAKTMKTKYDGNDLTFNKNDNFNNTLPNNKKIKSQQNSFSSMLIKQQNSFEPSYGSERRNEKKRFAFGCVPVMQSSQMRMHFNRFGDYQQDQGHRLKYLLTNLRDSSNQSFSSEQSSRYHFSREQSTGKSVLSKGVVKKYHI